MARRIGAGPNDVLRVQTALAEAAVGSGGCSEGGWAQNGGCLQGPWRRYLGTSLRPLGGGDPGPGRHRVHLYLEGGVAAVQTSLCCGFPDLLSRAGTISGTFSPACLLLLLSRVVVTGRSLQGAAWAPWLRLCSGSERPGLGCRSPSRPSPAHGLRVGAPGPLFLSTAPLGLSQGQAP